MKKKQKHPETRHRMITGREKVDEGAIRMMGIQGQIATKPKLAEEKNTQKRERNMTKERNIKTENTLSILQEEDTEPLLEEEEPPSIVKIDKDEKKIIEGKKKIPKQKEGRK